MSVGRTHTTPQSLSPQPWLLFAAFVASGAFLVVSLPPVPVAKALALSVAAAWIIMAGIGRLLRGTLDHRVFWALALCGGSIFASLVAGGFVFQTLFYDLYADMPLIQWLAFLGVFAVAASSLWVGRDLESGLAAIILFGGVLAAVLVAQQVSTGASRVFGSSSYAPAALLPLVPLAFSLGAASVGWRRSVLPGAGAAILLAIGVISGSTTGLLGALFAMTVTLATHPSVLSRLETRVVRLVRLIAMIGAILAVIGLLVIQVPALSGRWVNGDTLADLDKNVASRAYMWQGAQQMLVDRPIFGFGPSGYRVAAAGYLPAETFQFGTDRESDIDPTIYSPQSPHSLLWDIATRLGLLGVVSFATLLAAWVFSVRERILRGAGDTDLRLALAGAFLTGLFALLVNPSTFALGLLLPALAGVSVASWAPSVQSGSSAASTVVQMRPVLSLVGALLLICAVWLGLGQWRVATVPSNDGLAMLEGLESAQRILPGHPTIERQLLELRLLLAEDDVTVAAAQAEVDQGPPYIDAFAPNMVSFATFSLAQAERTGRADLSWEATQLDASAARMAPTPALVSERLHLALLSGDHAAIEEVLPEADQWGSPYPFYADYRARAEALLGQVR